MTLSNFLDKLATQPDTVEFAETMAIIDSLYDFTPTRLTNGNIINEAGQNNGSCKIFAFGKHNDLTEQQTLACFGRYYREDVLGNPDGQDHQNIRNFMQSGWAGLHFDGSALKEKVTS